MSNTIAPVQNKDRELFMNDEFGKSFIISFNYEKLNFKTAEFNGTKVTQIISLN